MLPPKLRPAAEEARVKQLVAAQWAAMSRQDWKTFYGYTSPAFRGAVPIETFLGKKSKLLYVDANVEWVEVTGEEARARVTYRYKFNEPAMSKMAPREDVVFEKWIKADGKWYRDLELPEEDSKKSEAKKTGA